MIYTLIVTLIIYTNFVRFAQKTCTILFNFYNCDKESPPEICDKLRVTPLLRIPIYYTRARDVSKAFSHIYIIYQLLYYDI